jgi:uncharacterized protein (DUF1778 family)
MRSGDKLAMTMAETASTNSERLNLRLTRAAKRRIEQAAAFAGKTVSGFIVAGGLRRSPAEAIANSRSAVRQLARVKPA